LKTLQIAAVHDILLRSVSQSHRFLTPFYIKQLQCGPMTNLMVALPNTDGAFCSTPQNLADAHY